VIYWHDGRRPELGVLRARWVGADFSLDWPVRRGWNTQLNGLSRLVRARPDQYDQRLWPLTSRAECLALWTGSGVRAANQVTVNGALAQSGDNESRPGYLRPSPG